MTDYDAADLLGCPSDNNMTDDNVNYEGGENNGGNNSNIYTWSASQINRFASRAVCMNSFPGPGW